MPIEGRRVAYGDTLSLALSLFNSWVPLEGEGIPILTRDFKYAPTPLPLRCDRFVGTYRWGGRFNI